MKVLLQKRFVKIVESFLLLRNNQINFKPQTHNTQTTKMNLELLYIAKWSTPTGKVFVYMTVDKGTFVIEKIKKCGRVDEKIVHRSKLRSTLIMDGVDLNFINSLLEK